MVDLNYELSLTDNGIKLAIYGYSEHAPLLFDEILKRLKAVTLSEQSFKQDKETLKMEYDNGVQESSLTQGLEILKSIIKKDTVTKKQKATAIRKVPSRNLKNICPTSTRLRIRWGYSMAICLPTRRKHLLKS